MEGSLKTGLFIRKQSALWSTIASDFYHCYHYCNNRIPFQYGIVHRESHFGYTDYLNCRKYRD